MASNLHVKNVLSPTAQFVQDQNGNTSPLALSTDAVAVGGNGSTGTIDVFDAGTKHTIRIGSVQGPGRIGLGGNGSIGTIEVFDADTRHTMSIGGAMGSGGIGLGGNGSIGTIDVFDANTRHTIRIGSVQGPGRIGLGGNGSRGVIDVFDANTNRTITIDGETGNVEVTGDIRLVNADCAEEFDTCATEEIEPGTVMVLGEEGVLNPSQSAYDKRVAGVVSGAGAYKPGIVLDKQEPSTTRKPIALLGKVYCKVDAGFGAIAVGDLLTTSPTPGRAMKADDPVKAFGTVIGKALRPFKEGQGLIPILIALQ